MSQPASQPASPLLPGTAPDGRVGKRGVRYRASDIASWIANRQTKAKPPRVS